MPAEPAPLTQTACGSTADGEPRSAEATATAAPGWTEEDRLAALRRYDILDTPPEPEFDDAVALVKTICGVPIALVSLVDAGRQWFKAKIGVDAEQTGIDTSVCALAIRQRDVFVIEDLSADPRTAHMSLVVDDPRIRFYAGAPLVTSEGFPLGSLCAIDIAARPGGLTAAQRAALEALGRQIVAQIELRIAVSARDRALVEQERRQQQAMRDSAIFRTMLDAQQHSLAGGGDFDETLQALVAAALYAVAPADGVSILLRDGDRLAPRAAAGEPAERPDRPVPIAGTLAGLCLTGQNTLIAEDAPHDERIDAGLADELGIGSLVVVPLSRRGDAFGVLTLRAATIHAFTSRDILVGQMLGGLITASFTESAESAALRQMDEAAESYRHIVDSAIDSAIISTDPEGRITSWSRGAETIMGWTETEVLGRPLDIIFTAEDVESGRLAREIATADRKGRASDERWHVRKDGSRYFAHGAVTPLLGRGKGYVKSLRNITDEHATRTALEASRLQLDVALDTGLIGFFNWNVVEDRVRGDARFAEFYGIAPDAAQNGIDLATSLVRLFPADLAGVQADLDAIIGRCGDFSLSYRLLDAAGGTRWMLVRGRCVEREGTRPIVYVGTAIDVTLQREAEERLRISRERLELATRAAELGSFDYLPRTGRLDWDDRCRALFGLPPGAPVGYETTFLAGLHPDDRQATDEAVAAALAPGGPGTFDIEYRTIGIADGVERVILAKGLAIFADGAAVRLIGTVQDVTADRTARATLAEAEERFRLAVRATNDAIWDWDLRQDRVRWNEALQRSYGHRPEDVAPTGPWWLGEIHPDDRDRVDRSIHAAIDGQGTDWAEDYRFRRADGSYADVRDRGYLIRDEQGQAIRMLGALLDQTDRKSAERHLQALNRALETSVTERTEELERLWQTSPDLLLVLDFAGLVQRVNPAWTTILGYRPEDLIGRRIDEFVLPDDAAATDRAIAEATGGGLPTVENRCLHRDGSIRWVSWAAAPTESGIYFTGRHVTAQKEAQTALRSTEDQLRQSQKVEAIGQLTGGVAHDFNNLLTVIRGSADLLRKPDLPEERRRRYIDAIADTADRATKLTSQLLAFARRSSLKPEIFDVGQAILSLRDMMGTLTGSMIRLDIRVPDEPCFIDADVSQFDTAIVNMAVNARDAMERKGSLTVTVEGARTVPAMRSHPSRTGRFVAVSITDTGSGIAADKIDQIFEPFFTTKDVGEGTGLGLSQVFGFSKQSGGEILVDSRIGEGTTFTLYLPRVAAVAGRAGDAGGEAVAEDRSACILVVEDNADVGSFATSALAELGHRTVLAANGEQALAKLAGGATSFDAVFSDVVMPGMSGIDLGREIRRLYPALPVLLTSGYSNVLAQEGTHGFALLHKPYSIEELSGALHRLTREAQTAD